MRKNKAEKFVEKAALENKGLEPVMIKKNTWKAVLSKFPKKVPPEYGNAYDRFFARRAYRNGAK